MATAEKVKIRLKKSEIGGTQRQRQTLRGLGLRTIGDVRELEKSDAELKARYAELSRLLADEQSRWTAFNAQLEALEMKRR